MKSVMTTTIMAAVLSCFGAVNATAEAHAATPVAQASQQKVAVIKIVIQEPDGTIIRAPIKAVHWGETVSFELSSDAHQHVVELRPDQGSDALAVDINYSRDGAPVSAQRSVAVGARRGSVVHKDNGAKVTVTVIPTKVTVDTHQ